MKMWWFSVCVFTSTVLSFTVSLPTTITPETTNTSPSVPLEFPTFNQNYTFVDNSSIRENLASHSDIDTEVSDLLKNEGENIEPAPSEEEEEETKTNQNIQINPSEQEDTGKKSAVEWIENGDDTEDSKFVTSEPVTVSEGSTKINEETSVTEKKSTVTTSEVNEVETTTTTEILEKLGPYKDGVPLIDGSVAAILVGTFLVMCIFGYTALIIWRRSLELKYGSREMLVDTDDIFDPDDLKHFSI